MSTDHNQKLEHPHVAEVVEHMRDHPDHTHVALADRVDAIVRFFGHIFCWANAFLVAVIILQVTLRYGFNGGLIIFEELQWHLYAIGVMFGLSYAQVNDSHIRVDILHMRLSDRTQRIIEIIGICLFVLPFIYVVFVYSLDFVADSWRTSERSAAPLGLPARWAIKSVIPLSFGLLGIAAVSRLIRDIVVLVRGIKPPIQEKEL